MKIGIIGSNISDLLIKRCINTSLHSCEEFLDEGLFTWENQSENIIIGRCESLLHLASGCDYVILPPQCEILYHKGVLQSSVKVIPLFLHYCSTFILSHSKVGKVACFATHLTSSTIKEFRTDCVKIYNPSKEQNLNRHFQAHFPLYHVDTKHWDSLYEINKSWLVNKYVKGCTRKLKDYAIDSFIIADWGYLYFLSILRRSLGPKVKHPSIIEISQLLGSLLS